MKIGFFFAIVFGLSSTPFFLQCDQKLTLNMRTRTEQPLESNQWEEKVVVKEFEAEKVAFLICDVWDKHWCKTLSARSEKIAYKTAPIVETLREKGVKIIHSPSNCMAYYHKKGAPPLPIDSSNCCPDIPPCKRQYPYLWTRQHPAIRIAKEDLISESGNYIHKFLKQKNIELLIIMGVHTNGCVLGRSFGIISMTKKGMPVVLVRNLTDAAYNPKQPPFVSQDEATELVVQWIEKYYCPSITSEDLI